ncbi:MAG: acyl-CoA desaturase [Bacteroidota bacterium]
MPHVKFSHDNAAFFNILRKRVNDYFKTKNIKPTGNMALYSKTIILAIAFLAAYIDLVFIHQPAFVSIIVCCITGLVMAAIGFNIFHDGAHGSYSSRKTINHIMACSLNFMGGSSYIWKQKHNINHHSYTNIEGLDDDIDIKPFFRTNTSQKRYWFHRFQHIYSFVLYGLTYLTWVFQNDFTKYFRGRISDHSTMKKMKLSEHIMFWVTKVTYLFTFLIIPAYVVGISHLIIGYSIIAFVCGIVIAFVFQLAHLHQAAEFVLPTNTDHYEVENEWAIHQIHSTINFDTRNKLVSWFCGGLNFQVEHHLFPKISHVHYPQINKIVKDTCKEFNIPYNEFPNTFSAIRSHLQFLKYIGRAA